MAYSRSRLSHAKELYYIVCIVLLVVITMFSVWGPGGYLEMKRLRRDLRTQKMRVEALERSNQIREESIRALRSDRETQERIARQNGFGRSGDIVQQLPDESKPRTEVQKR